MGNHEAGETPQSGPLKKPAFQLSRQPVVHGKPTEPTLPAETNPSPGGPPSHAGPAGPAELPAYEDLGALPTTYGSKSLYLVARDPQWFFTYWDVDWQAHPRIPGGHVILKIRDADGAEVYSTPVNPDARNWYLPVPRPNATFYAELGFLNAEGAWEVIARSNDTLTPSDALSEEAGDRFATVPFHLAFQKVLDMVKQSMAGEESLLAALSRLQSEGRRLVFALGSAPAWSDEQRRLLASLLGNELTELFKLPPGEIDALLRRQLQERLSSESASGSLLGSALLAGPAGSGSLAVGAFGSWKELGQPGALEHWVRAAESSFWSSWLSSWSGGLEELPSSWLTSWGGARESERAFWSSYLSSWGGESLASWASAVAPGESAFWSSWLFSWQGGMGGASAFGSREFGSSWSAQPFGAVPREFFLHVNAEVIFYGGTHPAAQVWVDGQPIPLNPDGTFRYHHRFPEGRCSIPIVAQSPDGREQRSATLHFGRGDLREGEVGHTAQPVWLENPPGRQP